MKNAIIFLSAVFCAIIMMGSSCASEQGQTGNSSLDNAKEIAEEAEEKVNLEIPADLIQCPADIFSNMNDCMDLEDDWVCGYDRTTYEDGSTEEHGLDYRTPCHYCNFFGKTMKKDMMGTQVVGLGYVKGKCQ